MKIRVAVLQAYTITIVAFVSSVRRPNTCRHAAPTPAHRPPLFFSCFCPTLSFAFHSGLCCWPLSQIGLSGLLYLFVVHGPSLPGFSAAASRNRKFPVKYLALTLGTSLLMSTSVWLRDLAVVFYKSSAHSPPPPFFLFVNWILSGCIRYIGYFRDYLWWMF